MCLRYGEVRIWKHLTAARNEARVAPSGLRSSTPILGIWLNVNGDVLMRRFSEAKNRFDDGPGRADVLVEALVPMEEIEKVSAGQVMTAMREKEPTTSCVLGARDQIRPSACFRPSGGDCAGLPARFRSLWRVAFRRRPDARFADPYYRSHTDGREQIALPPNPVTGP